MMKYYQQKLLLAKVDKNDKIVGKIERWQAHKKGALHRGFTVILIYQDNIVLQHRKHLVFDGYFDLTFSSHQVYKNNKLQTDLQAIYETLKREWGIDRAELIDEPRFLSKFYYKAKDRQSAHIEHEIDYVYQAELKTPPTPNLDFAYGCSLINRNRVLDSGFLILNPLLAPWAKKIIKTILNKRNTKKLKTV